MIYTYQRRKEMNEVLLAKLKIDNAKIERGVPYLYIAHLPESTERVNSIADLLFKLSQKAKPWDEVIPVFIKMQQEETVSYQVNYVNSSPGSIAMATEKIKLGDMWMIPELILKRGVDF